MLVMFLRSEPSMLMEKMSCMALCLVKNTIRPFEENWGSPSRTGPGVEMSGRRSRFPSGFIR